MVRVILPMWFSIIMDFYLFGSRHEISVLMPNFSIGSSFCRRGDLDLHKVSQAYGIRIKSHLALAEQLPDVSFCIDHEHEVIELANDDKCEEISDQV